MEKVTKIRETVWKNLIKDIYYKRNGKTYKYTLLPWTLQSMQKQNN